MEMSDEEKYKQLMASRAALASEMGGENGSEDLSGDPGEGVGQEYVASSRGMNMNTPEAQAGNAGKLQTAGDTTMAAGAATGNPYVGAAGLAIKTAGMVDDAARKGEQAKIDAYNKKIMAQRSAIRNIFA